MRLRYIRLENYTFFNSGMDKNVVEMEFDKDDDIVIVSGDNGSGKTTFTKLAHSPLPKIDNSYGIIKNHAGKKIQIYVDEKNDREIEVIHNFNPKKDTHSCDSFMNIIEGGEKKELNNNGSVRSFYDLVEEYFGITRNNEDVLYTAVKELGLVTKTSAERREYVKGFINGLEEIDERYKVVNEKYSIIKKELKANGIKLKKYPDSDEMKSEIKEMKKMVTIKKSELKNIHKKMGTIENISQEELEEINETRKKYKKDISDSKEAIKILDKLDSKKSLKYNEDEYKGYLKRNKDKLNDIEQDIKSKNKALINLKKDSQGLVKLKEDRQYVQSLGERLDSVDENIKKIETNYNYEEYSEIKTFVNNVITSLDMLSNNIIEIDSLKKDLKKELEKKEKEAEDLSKSQNEIKKKMESISGSYGGFFDENIKPHPKCEFESCDLRQAFNGYISNMDEINELSTKINLISEKIENTEEETQIIKNDIQWKERYDRLVSELEDKEELLNKDEDLKKLTKDNVFGTLKSGKYSQLENKVSIKFDKLDKYFKYQDDKKRYESFNSVSEKENDLLDRYEKEKEKILEKRKKLNEKKKEIEEKIEKYNKKMNKLSIGFNNNLVENLNMESLKEIIDEREKSIDKLDGRLEEIQKKIESKKALEKSEKNINEELKTYEKRVDKLNEDLTIMKHLEKEYVRLNKEEKITYAVRETLRIHLPITLIDSFLESVKLYANKFLKDANLEYRVSDFEISENTFRIESMKKNHIYTDVSNMSDGETCFMSLAISFAIQVVLESLNNYKIVALDEMDSLLKDSRKKKYMDIVMSQFNNFDLSQMFIVTHNEYFNDLNNVSHICLKDSTVDKFDKSKKIIYHHSD